MSRPITLVSGPAFLYYDLDDGSSDATYFDLFGDDLLGMTPGSGLILLRLDPVVIPGGGGADAFLSTTNHGSPAVVIVPNGNGGPQPAPDPVIIIDVGAQQSANTSGASTIAGVNNGSIGSFGSFTGNIGNHIHRMTGLDGFGGGFAFHRPNPRLNVAIAGSEDRWTGAIHPFAGVAGAPIVVEVKPRNWEIFTMGAFSRQDQDRIGIDPGFTGDTWTGTVGIERRIGQQLLVGFATTLGTQDIDTPGKLGNAEIDGTLLDAYAIYAKDHFWTSLRYGVGFQDIDINRRAFRGITARASTDSLNHVIGWGAGLNKPLELFGMDFVHGPNVGLEYMTGQIDGYTERGADAFNLIVDEHNWASLESELGWSIAKAHDLDKLGRGFLQLRASWNHEHIRNESNTEFSLENSPVSIFDPATGLTTAGDNSFRGQSHNATPQDDWMSIGLHLTHFLGAEELWTLRAGYQTQLFRSDYAEHYVYGRLGRAF